MKFILYYIIIIKLEYIKVIIYIIFELIDEGYSNNPR